MNQNRPYINKLVRIKEMQIEDSNHDIILRELKPLTKRLIERPTIRTISNLKRQKIQQQRQFSINYENEILTKKISNMKSTYKECSNTKGFYKTLQTRNKSLHQVRKKDHRNIQDQNLKMFQRIAEQRSTIKRLQMQKDWSHAQSISKMITNRDFNLTNLKSKWNIREPSSEKYHKLMGVKMYRTKKINGNKMMVNVQLNKRGLQILCDLIDRQDEDYKIIKIDREEAFKILQGCGGQIQGIFDRIHYDQNSRNVYIIKEEEEEDFYSFQEKSINPELNKLWFRGLSEKKELFRVNEEGLISRIQKVEKKRLRNKLKKIDTPLLQDTLRQKQEPKTSPSNEKISKQTLSNKEKMLHNLTKQKLLEDNSKEHRKSKKQKKQQSNQARQKRQMEEQVVRQEDRKQQEYQIDEFQKNEQSRQVQKGQAQKELVASKTQLVEKGEQQSYEQQFQQQIQQN